MALTFYLPNTVFLRECIGVALSALMGLVPLAAQAELGAAPLKPQASAAGGMPVARASVQLPGALAVSYDTVVQQLPTGTVLTEFVSNSGVVFALSWNGPRTVDMETVLGSYFPAFKAQAEASRVSRSLRTPLGFDTGALVVFSAGHLRNFFGYAYAPALVPPGLNVRDVLH
jgi:Protein of unknown function (DUF2844)